MRKELEEKKNDLITKAEGMLDTAKMEKRELTEDEAAELAEIRDNVRRIVETLKLDDDFREAYNNARRLVRTETARVQSRATQDRYREAGFTKYRIIAEPDCCEVCAVLAEQVFDIDELVIPAHPNCRCAMAAITESLQ